MSIDPTDRPAREAPAPGGRGVGREPAAGGGRGFGREFSAGGVVVRGGDVVVIVPTRRSAAGARVLALPKGLVEEGESAERAALREVREEAGVTGEVAESLGFSEYFYTRDGRRIAKRVEFFLIDYRAGDPAEHDHEVEDARWMPLAQAALALSYAGEREVVQRAISKRPSGR